MRCGNSQNMENEKGIISSPPSLYLSHSHHCCFSSFSNPNSFSLTITITNTITKHHQQIFTPRFFSFSSVSSCSFRFLFGSRSLFPTPVFRIRFKQFHQS